MSKKFLAIIMAMLCCLSAALVGCSAEPGPKGDKGDTGAAGATGEQGEKGEDGRGIESMLINEEGHLIIYYTDAPETPVDLGKIVGEDGAAGGPGGGSGVDGKSPELRVNGGYIQWKYTTDSTWINLIALDDLKGPQGPQGQPGTGGSGGSVAGVTYYGVEVPASSYGFDGDFFIELDTNILYVKRNGEWKVLLKDFGSSSSAVAEYYNPNLFDLSRMGTSATEKAPQGKAMAIEDNTGNLEGWWIGDGSGTPVEISTSNLATHFIPVEYGKTYLYNGMGNATSKVQASNYKKVLLYDAEYNYLGTTTGGRAYATVFDDNGTPDLMDDDILQFALTSSIYQNAKYARFNIVNATNGNFMVVEKGEAGKEWPHTYVSYGERLAIPEPDNLVEELLNEQNPLFRKKAIWTGSSVMEGKGNKGGFAKMISMANEMSYNNIGISGGTLASGVGQFEIAQSVVNYINADVDYFIFLGGYNDYCHRGDSQYASKPLLGTVSEGFDAELDMTTTLGALESACKALKARKATDPDFKYGYVFYHKIWKDTDEWTTTWRPAILEVLEKWDCPYIDMEVEAPTLGIDSTLYSQYTMDSDRVHPNEEGYKKFYVNPVTAWMKTL